MVTDLAAQKMGVPAKAIEMVQAFLDDYEIVAIGGVVHKFKPGSPGSGDGLMLTSVAAKCRDYLRSVGIAMERVDSGGSPQWSFKVSTLS